MFLSRFLRAVMVLAGGGVLFAPAASANLITNGDFSAGNTGFASGYGYVAPGLNTCWPEGTYSIVSSPNACHSLWSPFGDHTTGSGNMMVVNGAPAANVTVWSETVSVLANSQYNFSAWVASVYPSSPAQLEFLINGVQVGGAFTASTTAGLWQQFSGNWSSGSMTAATLSIVDLNIVLGGNDFALDDLSFVDPVPESNSAILWSLALAALVWQGRRLATRLPR